VKHAILSDIHGNIDALETVLADVEARGIGSMVCLGDFVGYGAAPNECIEALRGRIVHAVAGNHDLAACGRLKLQYFNPEAAEAARWTDVRLTDDHRSYLAELPYMVSWRGFRLVHATPSDPPAWEYVLSPQDALMELDAFDEATCLFGHSHYAGIFVCRDDDVRYTREHEVRMEAGHRYMVNVGSVGQPRDGDPRAAYLMVDESKRTLTHVRLEYDVEAAGQRIRDAGLPPFLAERLRWGE